MKLHIISDLHLSVCPMAQPQTNADIVILAGDLARPAAAAEWAKGFKQPVLYVPGNHEFYGSSVRATPAALHQFCDGSNVHVLDNETYEQDGVRFVGSTLWTDFLINGAGAAEAEAMEKAQAFMKDFKIVEIDTPAGSRTLTPTDTTELFARNTAWLKEELAQPYAGTTVVITHHAPSPHSIHPRFAGSPFNAGFVSDLEYLMGADRVKLWIHGHTHDSFDYAVNGTRVLCNPRGYVKNGKQENPAFQPELVVDLE
ncbi:MAG: metallophosphoesterase [Burkholderiaceae bacterium]|nr:MAG: metallophosphoesterase [Burkholderiaceae bacterium]